jgi:glycosyltransferase involved in cell wall biosynthesis
MNNVILLPIKNYNSATFSKNKIYFLVNKVKRFNFLVKYLIKFNSIYKKIISSLLLKNSDFDILFCPFSYPTFIKPNIPIVSIIYDFQFNAYPNFFTGLDLEQRKNTAIKCLKESKIIVCISSFTKNSAIKFDNHAASKLKVVHIERNLNKKLYNYLDFSLTQFNPYKTDYILYPANFWLHKNHEMLFVSLNMLLKKYPVYSKLVLVCTGAKSARSDYLLDLSISMGLKNNIIFTNFLNEDDYYNIFSMAKLMVYPSLYEGFGMPLIEAMELGVPIASSNLCSLPEIAGNSAIYFNPKLPCEITNSIHSILSRPYLQDELKMNGKLRIKNFNSIKRMANKYTEIFNSALLN